MEQLNSIRLRRRIDKINVTIKEYNELELKEEVNLQDLIKIKISLKLSLENLNKDLENYAQNGGTEGMINLALDTQNQAEDVIVSLETTYQMCQTKLQPKAINTDPITKLPTLQLPKFSGDILNFKEFYDRFESSVLVRELKDVDKLAYLLGCLEGPALDVVKGLGTTNKNLSIALDLLKDRYGKSSLVIDAHYRALNDISKTNYNSVQCRQTLNSIRRHLRILQSLGENTEANHLRILILDKFPERTKYELTLINGSNDSVEEILKGLERIIMAMELAEPSCTTDAKPATTTEALHILHKRPTHLKNLKRKYPEKSTVLTEATKNKKPRLPCLFCENISHSSTTCPNAKTVEERRKRLGNRCFLCLQKAHNAKNCTTKKKCYFCRGNHHQLLCSKRRGKFNKKETITDNYNSIVCKASNGKTFLQTAVVKISNPIITNKQKCLRLLLDSGSQRSYITTTAAQELGLSSDKKDKLLIFTFGSSKPHEIISPSIEIILETKRGNKRTLSVNIVPRITDYIPVSDLSSTNLVDIMADDNSLGQNIDLLIGNDYYFSFMRNNSIKIDEYLYLVDSEFGWLVTGNVTENTDYDTLSVVTYCQCYNLNNQNYVEPDLPLRNTDIKFLWALESIGITDSPKVTQQEEAVKHFNDTVQYKGGRIEIKWPWIQYPPDLPTNYGLAYGRLKGLLKRTNLETLNEYNQVLKEQLEADIIEVVNIDNSVNMNNQSTPPIHYLPHHIVKQEGKTGRIVYDASSKTTSNKSLNENLYSGPSMIEDLTSLLLKFRAKRIGIIADVEKAFLQIGIQENDRDVTRFLWVKNVTKDVTEDNLIHMRFKRMPFGIISSPFLLNAAIRYHIATTEENLLKDIADKCYVDNLVTSTDSTAEAQILYEQVQKVFCQISMKMRDWLSNDEKFLQSVKEEHKVKKVIETKVLGLIWNVNNDSLKIKPNDSKTKCPNTKRNVLRNLARIYDPFGLGSPLTLSMKLLFQEICKMKLKWDAELPSGLILKVEKAVDNLEKLNNLEVPRFIGSRTSGEIRYQLHCFTDASLDAYAAVVYLRGNDTKSTLVMSKSRVTPIDEKDHLKIPKLELLGYLIGSRLLKYVRENLDLPIEKEFLWTDSMVVLCWMKSDRLLPPFVSRRVNEIKQNTQGVMRYISTDINPADVATRPQTWEQKKGLWFHGPSFLSQNEDLWPSQGRMTEETLLLAREALDTVCPDNRTLVEQPYCTTEVTEERRNSKDASQDGTTRKLDSHLNEIKSIQAKYFPNEVAGKETHLSRNLALYLDVDGILRSKGRMANTTWAYEMKHPILLPKDCEFTNCIIQQTHEKNYHVGPSHTLNLIRQRYWIPQGRANIQKILRRCPQCIKHGGGPYKLPPTPALPAERVNYSNPFTFTGIDYFGPMYVTTKTGKEKRWVCLLTCLAIRAIHLEIVKDLTAEECLLALRRFVAARGLPKLIVSDNALQFKLTGEILSSPFSVENGVRWKFIPQLAPWHGGFYERLVGLVKHCLRRTLEKHLLHDSQLLTVIKEVESVINTRPLTRVGAEQEHALKPADFLCLGNCISMKPLEAIPRVCTATKQDLIQSWKRGQIILGEFKKIFTEQYLTSLRERYKHGTKQPRVRSNCIPQVGDIVQLRGESKNRENWKVGKIISLIRGSDGECRVAKVNINNQEFIRSIGHLYPLEMQYEDEMDTQEKGKQINTLNQPLNQISSIQSQTSVPHATIEETVPITVPLPQADEPMISEMEVVNDHNDADVVSEIILEEAVPPTETAVSTLGQAQNLLVDPEEQVIVQPMDISPSEEAIPEDCFEPKTQRAAAIKARERIAQMSRNLLTLLN